MRNSANVDQTVRRVRTLKQAGGARSATIWIVPRWVSVVVAALVGFDGRTDERSASSANAGADRGATHVAGGGGADERTCGSTEARALTGRRVT